MGKPIKADIKSELLVWARKNCRMDLEYAAKKIKIPQQKLEQWEAGDEKPTIRQLRTVAKVYRVNFGAFFLPNAPDRFKTPVKDYRLHHGDKGEGIDPEITIDLRLNLDARSVALELYDELKLSIPTFDLSSNLEESIPSVANRIRTNLQLTIQKQKTYRNTRVAFNAWREAISKFGVFVLQSSKISLRDMRGYSVYFDRLPLIVVNRKDAYSARTFSLLHEFTHLLLRSNGLCDLHTSSEHVSTDQKTEVFCNAVAAQTLVPDEYLFSYKSIFEVGPDQWNDENLAPIARDFGVSREVILRKLLDHGLTTREFYLENRERYKQEAINYKNKQKGGFVPPSVDVVSTKGKQFVSLVIDAMNSSLITQNDASDFLGVRAKHFPAIEANLRG